MNPRSDWITLSEEVQELPTDPFRPATRSSLTRNPVDGIRYQVTETVIGRGTDLGATADTVVVSMQQEVYNLQWTLPKGQGSGQTMQVIVCAY